MQQRLREAREESLFRSVGRRNGHKGFFAKLFRRNGRAEDGHGGDGIRRGHSGMDFHDRGEDVWRALRF